MLTTKKMNLESKENAKEYTRQFDHAPLVSMGYKVPTHKTYFDEEAGCDIYVASGNYHFRTGMANGEPTSPAFETYDDGLAMIERMVELGVPGIWHIAKSLEDGKLYILQTRTHSPRK